MLFDGTVILGITVPSVAKTWCVINLCVPRSGDVNFRSTAKHYLFHNMPLNTFEHYWTRDGNDRDNLEPGTGTKATRILIRNSLWNWELFCQPAIPQKQMLLEWPLSLFLEAKQRKLYGNHELFEDGSVWLRVCSLHAGSSVTTYIFDNCEEFRTDSLVLWKLRKHRTNRCCFLSISPFRVNLWGKWS